jgi:hypothetical protein
MAKMRDRIEVWADEEDFFPLKTNRQIRKAKRHKTKDKMKSMLRDIESGLVDDEYFDNFSENTLDNY